MIARTGFSLAALAGITLAGGCAGPDVDAPIGGSITMAAIAEERSQETLTNVPSTPGLDRSHWTVIRYEVPVDTDPRYAGSLLTNKQNYGQVIAYGAYPTAQSCVNLERQNPNEWLDVLTAPFVAVVDLPVSFFPGEYDRSPENLAKRNAPRQRMPVQESSDDPSADAGMYGEGS